MIKIKLISIGFVVIIAGLFSFIVGCVTCVASNYSGDVAIVLIFLSIVITIVGLLCIIVAIVIRRKGNKY